MEDGIRSKIMQMDDECQLKLQDTMQKIVNDSNGGMICIIIWYIETEYFSFISGWYLLY